MTVAVGVGYDSHRFEAGRRLVLGGVEIPHDRGLAGHSDPVAFRSFKVKRLTATP